MKAPLRAVIPAVGFGFAMLARFGQGTGTGVPPHPDSDPAPAVSGRPVASQQTRADVRPASARGPAAPPGTAAGARLLIPLAAARPPLSSSFACMRNGPARRQQLFWDFLENFAAARSGLR